MMRPIESRSYQVIKARIRAIKGPFRRFLFGSQLAQQHTTVPNQKPPRLNPYLHVSFSLLFILILNGPNPIIQPIDVHTLFLRPVIDAHSTTNVDVLYLWEEFTLLEDVFYCWDQYVFVLAFEVGTDVLVQTHDVDVWLVRDLDQLLELLVVNAEFARGTAGYRLVGFACA